MTTYQFTDHLRLAADYIDGHGWTQGAMQDEEGRVCLTGAIRECSPVPGDDHLIRQVLLERDRAEFWNDDSSRTADEVTDYLRTAEVTDADLADTFGPQWEAIVALVRRAAVLTEGEARQLHAAWAAARGAARDAARHAARDAAWHAARDAAWHAACVAAWAAAQNAARALAVRDLIGQHGFTQEMYSTLVAPWATTIGKVHPDDADRLVTP